ncbi:uncharacterized protein LOC6651473 [Drosophila willistoni]|nr:uncharacterized protein LOC6651473 [Drosophila willistoni]
MLRNGQTLEDNHPAAMLSRFNAPTMDTERREMAAYATIAAAKAFRKNFQHIDELARQSHAHKISLRRTALEALCPPRDPPSCMPASERYRTHDGTCNNKRRPRWGAAQMPFNRFLPPEYGDGVDSVRSSTDGSPLSSSRFVSLLVHGSREGEAPLTIMIAQWGQLLDHDMTSTAQPRSINGSIPSCCGGNDFHPSCFPIKVPLDDPWLAPLKVRCLEFLRSAPAQRRDCVLSWREQTNQVTSYIDASPIYSNSAKSSDNARVFRHGLLIYGRGNPAEDVCQRGAIATKCIRSGDGRSSEQPGLLAMHHVWVGEHNRIALEISELNPHWSDEKIYQETRRIVGAMFQHITYREFLPVILGREVCKLFDLDLLSTGYYEGYEAKVNPTVANAFAAAAFRFGHSLVQNSYTRCDRHHNVINNNVSLHEEFQSGDIGSAGSLHRLLRGLATQRALKRDEFITPELTNHLFQTSGFPFGLDLAAINIQRGRDHGIAPYTSWRVPCGLSPIHSWDDFANVVGPESAKRIGHAYRSIHDIDLFVGGIAERPVVGGLVGPTFACIIAQQFSNARRGDRFWYENAGFESSFTPAQLHSLRRVSLAQVLCRAVGGGTFQPHIFIPAEFTDNERQTCGTGVLSPIDLSPWLEQDPFAAPAPSAAQADQVFNIIKEDKAGFSNRIKPVRPPQVEFSANSANGIQRPAPTTNSNASKVSDKLDLKRKTIPTITTQTNNNNRRKTTATQKPVNGINNKLDKSPKITINIKNINIRKQDGTTPKRKVIINNVPIELRSAVNGNATNADDETETDPTMDDTESEPEVDDDKDLLESRADDMELETTEQTIPTTTTRRELDPNETSTNANDLRELRSLTDSKTPDFRLLHLIRNHTTLQTSSTTSISMARSTRTTQFPKFQKTTTKRVQELRSQYQSRPIYTRPQKVVVNGPNADQYEIEINIRQTNKSPVTRPLTPEYADYTTVYKPFNNNHNNNYDTNYAPHYVDYASTTTISPNYGYYGQKLTKPPTIIYLNDNDDRRQTTTRAPNIFQNFLTFATNGFNPNPNANRRPTTARPSVERPQFNSYVINSPLSGHGSSISSSPSPYAPRPPSVPSVSSYPVSSSSQIGGNPQSGYLHASSSAVSAGHFGTISGVASANGADSTFSFNIRPRPSNPQTIHSPANSYGLASQSPYKPDYPYGQSELYYDREISPDNPNPSPFSTSVARPHTQTYFGRTPELKEANNNELTNPDHKLDIQDYDYLTRNLANVTEDQSKEEDSKEPDDYTYDDDEPNNNLEAQVSPKNQLQLDKSNDMTNSTSNSTQLDDNYVLPVLKNNTLTKYVTEMPKPIVSTPSSSRSSTNSKVTVFPDSLAKQLANGILADTDDYDDRTLTETGSLKKQATKLAQLANVAFAPITVLTKPDRPDNWVIYNKASEEPPLPQPPVVSMEDVAPTGEVPTPIKRLQNAQPKPTIKLDTTTTTSTAADVGVKSDLSETTTTQIPTTEEATSISASN